MDILQLGLLSLLVLLGKIMPPLLPVQSQLRQDFKKKDDGLQALGLESLHCKSARVQVAATGFYPIDSEVIYFSPMITLISKKMGVPQLQPSLNLQPYFFRKLPPNKIFQPPPWPGLVGTLGIHDALLKVGLPDEELQIPWASGMWTLEVLVKRRVEKWPRKSRRIYMCLSICSHYIYIFIYAYIFWRSVCISINCVVLCIVYGVLMHFFTI